MTVSDALLKRLDERLYELSRIVAGHEEILRHQQRQIDELVRFAEDLKRLTVRLALALIAATMLASGVISPAVARLIASAFGAAGGS